MRARRLPGLTWSSHENIANSCRPAQRLIADTAFQRFRRLTRNPIDRNDHGHDRRIDRNMARVIGRPMAQSTCN
jgi:hypothetical protein